MFKISTSELTNEDKEMKRNGVSATQHYFRKIFLAKLPIRKAFISTCGERERERETSSIVLAFRGQPKSQLSD